MIKNNLSHLAFILDGNKRWAKNKKLSNIEGYKQGFEKIKEIVNYSLKINISNLTLYTLSSENINRPSINIIYEIIYKNLTIMIDEFVKNKNINLHIFGSKKNLPRKILNIISDVEKYKNEKPSLNLNLAFNYGFKEEIRDVLHNYKNNNYNINLNNENEIRNLFNLKSSNDPDILIRTGGYKRLSNFIMYNLTYTELFFVDTLWPDFSVNELNQIINQYSKIDRKYGL